MSFATSLISNFSGFGTPPTHVAFLNGRLTFTIMHVVLPKKSSSGGGYQATVFEWIGYG
jgi:hypothetical protein